MFSAPAVFSLLTFAATVVARAPFYPPEPCSLPRGNWVINQLGLYPENLDIDTKRCTAWLGALWNGTVTEYDIRKEKVIGSLSIPGTAGSHTSGIQIDNQHDHMIIIQDSGLAFDTLGQNLSGDTFTSLYNLKARQFEWVVNITHFLTGEYGGFQDAETDTEGNVFIVGGYPSAIMRISVDGKSIKTWYADPNKDHLRYGFTGIAALDNGQRFLVSDNITGGFWTFNPRDREGKPTPVHLPGNKPLAAGQWDGIVLPKMFKQKVLLVSDDYNGTWVIRSKDGKWNNAESLGVIPRQLVEDGGLPTATVEINDRTFVSSEYFYDTVHNRTRFPYYDITDDIFKLLACD